MDYESFVASKAQDRPECFGRYRACALDCNDWCACRDAELLAEAPLCYARDWCSASDAERCARQWGDRMLLLCADEAERRRRRF